MTGFKIKTELIIGNEKAVRTMVVPTDITLGDLSDAIIIAFDWKDIHPHSFDMVGRKHRKLDDEEYLSAYVGKKIVYTYDLFYEWEHRISFLKNDEEFDEDHPVLIKCEGERPLEDIGGLRGHQRLKAVLKDENHPDHKDVVELYSREGPLNDMEQLNRRLAGDAEAGYITSDKLEEIAEYFRSEGDTDIYYIPATGEIFEDFQDEGREDGILILKGGETALYDIAYDYLCERPKLQKKFKHDEITSSNYDEFEKAVEYLKMYEDWGATLEERTYVIAVEWACENNLRNKFGELMETYYRNMDSDQGRLDLPPELMSMAGLALSMNPPVLTCKYCGHREKGVVRLDMNPSEIKRMPAYPVEMICSKCNRSSMTRALNDGFVVDYHYSSDDLPCDMYYKFHELERKAENLPEGDEKFRLRLEMFREGLMICSGRRGEYANELGKYLDNVTDKVLKAEGLLAYYSFNEPDDADVDRINDALATCENVKDPFVQALRCIIAMCTGDVEENLEEVKEVLTDMPAVLKGYVLICALRNIDTESESLDGLIRLSIGTLDELADLSMNEKDLWSAYPRMFSRLHFEALSFCMVTDRMELAGELVESRYDRLMDKGEKCPYTTLTFILLMRRALYRLGTGKKKEGSKDLEDIRKYYQELMDYGPYTNRVFCIAEALLLEYGKIDINEITNALRLVITMADMNQIDVNWLNWYLTILAPLSLKHYGERKTLSMIKDMGIHITDVKELKKQKFDLKFIWVTDLLNLE